MVFFMRGCLKIIMRYGNFWFFAFCIVGLMLILASGKYTNSRLLSHGVDIKSANLVYKKGNATLNADIDYHFSQTALKALENGIPLPLEVEVMVKSQRKWLWDKTELHETIGYQIRYLALSKSYELINESSGSRRNFASRRVAIDALGRIRSMPVAKSFCPINERHCLLLLKVTLNREGLPLPLRPVSYVTLDWYLSSRWKQWPLTS